MAWQLNFGLYRSNWVPNSGQLLPGVVYGSFDLTPWGNGQSFQYTGVIAIDGEANANFNGDGKFFNSPLEPGVAAPIYNFGGNNYSGHTIDVIGLNMNQLPGHWACGVQVSRFWGGQNRFAATTGMQYVTSYCWLSPAAVFNGVWRPYFMPYSWNGRTWDIASSGAPVQRVFQTTWPWSAQKPVFSSDGNCLYFPFSPTYPGNGQNLTGITDDVVWMAQVWSYTQQPLDSIELVNTGLSPQMPHTLFETYPSAYCGTQGVPGYNLSAGIGTFPINTNLGTLTPGVTVVQTQRRLVFDPRITQYNGKWPGPGDYTGWDWYSASTWVENDWCYPLLYTYHDFSDQQDIFGVVGPTPSWFKWWYDIGTEDNRGIPQLTLDLPGPYAVPIGLGYYLVYLGAKQV